MRREVLREDFLKPLGMSANALAKALSIPAPRISDVVRERPDISAETARGGSGISVVMRVRG